MQTIAAPLRVDEVKKGRHAANHDFFLFGIGPARLTINSFGTKQSLHPRVGTMRDLSAAEAPQNPLKE